MIKEFRYSDFIEEVPMQRDWIDDKGREVLSPVPREVPIPALSAPAAPSSMMELMHRLYQEMAANSQVESPEDADDFDIPDELGIEMWSTPYEKDFDHLSGSAAAPAVPPAVPAADPEVVQD